ncbi:hypothetical protein [Paracoccus sp. (in: a-proteobacteria)]|uniref:hypothetical protein n=1 Tax=Paracoccus sp. TaxID=267 RepID=UPI00322042F3
MHDKQLARWTLSWFGSALAFLLAALALAVVLVPAPGDWQSGRGLALVHLFVLGWLGQMMLGAMMQFLPVFLARPLPWPRLPLAALLAVAPGVLLLAAGFLTLEGGGPGGMVLELAVLVLGAGLGIGVLLLGRMLAAPAVWREPTGGLTALALLALMLLWASGSGMARMLAGAEGGLTLLALPLHVGLGLGGWLGLVTLGVSYRIFGMFLIAPDRAGWPRRLTLWLGVLLLVTLAVGLAWVTLTGDLPAALMPAAAGIGLAIAGCYLAEIRSIWKSRRRPRPELNMRMSRPALGFLALSALLALPAALLGGPLAEATVFAATVGWLSGLTLAQLLKIASFLTWIQVFSTRIGRGPLPQVHELTSETRGRFCLRLWYGAAGLGTAALLIGQAALLRLALLLLLIAAIGLVHELWRIRRLVHVRPELRPAPLPPLFLPVHTEPPR